MALCPLAVIFLTAERCRGRRGARRMGRKRPASVYAAIYEGIEPGGGGPARRRDGAIVRDWAGGCNREGPGGGSSTARRRAGSLHRPVSGGPDGGCVVGCGTASPSAIGVVRWRNLSISRNGLYYGC